MRTNCSSDLFCFAPVEGRRVEAAFDGGSISSDGGALLLGATDRALGLVERFAGCFRDHRQAELVEHEVRTLVGQRVFGQALGYEASTITTGCGTILCLQCWWASSRRVVGPVRRRPVSRR